jgi:DNA polymerase-3 subunit gamma/tau
MATTDAYKVPVTITSRSQSFTFKLADPSTMSEYLKSVAKKEKINIDDEALKIVVKRGGGSFRDSLSLLDQVSTLSDDKIAAALITKALGLPQQESVTNILNGYAAGDATRVREQLQNLLDSGIKPEVIADNLISSILENPQPIHLGLLDKLTEVSRSAYPNVKLLLALTAPAGIPAPTMTMATPTIRPVAAPAKPAPAKEMAPKPTPHTEVAKEPKETAAPETPATKPAEPTQPEQPAAPEAQPAKSETPAAPATPTISSTADAAEIWNQILLHVQEKAPSIYKMLEDSGYTIKNNVITIYSKKKFAKTQITKRIPILAEILPNEYTIEVNDQTLNQDADMAAIAELMGGGEEVQIDA